MFLVASVECLIPVCLCIGEASTQLRVIGISQPPAEAAELRVIGISQPPAEAAELRVIGISQPPAEAAEFTSQ